MAVDLWSHGKRNRRCLRDRYLNHMDVTLYGAIGHVKYRVMARREV
jgi:hypothetical protein